MWFVFVVKPNFILAYIDHMEGEGEGRVAH